MRSRRAGQGPDDAARPQRQRGAGRRPLARRLRSGSAGAPTPGPGARALLLAAGARALLLAAGAHALLFSAGARALFVAGARALLFVSGAWALLFVTSACAPEAPATGARPSDGTTGGTGPARRELSVYAATSTRDPLLALEDLYERARPVDLVFNFGSSGDLSRQILAAAQADVFLSADEQELDRVEQGGLLASGSRRDLLGNALVVVEPADAPALFTMPFEPAQLAGAGVQRLSLGQVDTVPAGRYARDWLERVGVWAQVAPRVLPGVDARAALAAVESGAVQAGIVYRTDAARSQRVRLVFEVPLAQGPSIRYPVAAIAGRPHEAEARAFIGFLGEAAASAVFEQAGFVLLPTRATAPARQDAR